MFFSAPTSLGPKHDFPEAEAPGTVPAAFVGARTRVVAKIYMTIGRSSRSPISAAAHKPDTGWKTCAPKICAGSGTGAPKSFFILAPTEMRGFTGMGPGTCQWYHSDRPVAAHGSDGLQKQDPGLMFRMWIVGGLGGASDLSNEVFYLDTNKVPPEWVQVNASGYIPPIHSAAAAMDSRDRLWVMGGMLRTTDGLNLSPGPSLIRPKFLLYGYMDPPIWVNASTSGTLNQAREDAIATMDSRGFYKSDVGLRRHVVIDGSPCRMAD
ncbi:hypothetical protein AK812_SmicGene6625 [Symbiodinium microadriaticum]|uniref:Uncharacterized protein n=1 Tax=Symbiodinium microadriaticum TaxID=2951 RepID=A0A1Q9EQT8_SYMMI|nr:hypothetical protein AK812_SmicGene6625 [Symbiodinium microadriaticum]